MIALGMVAYYALAVALLAFVVRLAVRRSERDADAAYARVNASLRKWADTVPPLPPRDPPPLPPEGGWDVEATDLSAAALGPIAPLLQRVAREYLDKPGERERLVISLTRALGEDPLPTS